MGGRKREEGLDLAAVITWDNTLPDVMSLQSLFTHQLNAAASAGFTVALKSPISSNYTDNHKDAKTIKGRQVMPQSSDYCLDLTKIYNYSI